MNRLEFDYTLLHTPFDKSRAWARKQVAYLDQDFITGAVKYLITADADNKDKSTRVSLQVARLNERSEFTSAPFSRFECRQGHRFSVDWLIDEINGRPAQGPGEERLVHIYGRPNPANNPSNRFIDFYYDMLFRLGEMRLVTANSEGQRSIMLDTVVGLDLVCDEGSYPAWEPS